MANPWHLEILKQGVKAWKAWRDQHRGTVEVDATLSAAILKGWPHTTGTGIPPA